MKNDLSFIIPGIIFGLSSGMSPGPLLTLVISETLKHGIKEGVKIAIAPLLSDLPIVLVTITLLSYLSDIRPVIGVISLMGGAFLCVALSLDARLVQSLKGSKELGLVLRGKTTAIVDHPKAGLTIPHRPTQLDPWWPAAVLDCVGKIVDPYFLDPRAIAQRRRPGVGQDDLGLVVLDLVG